MGLVTRGRSFGPAAPKTDKEVSGEESDPGVLDSHFPFTSSHIAQSEASAPKSSPILQENSANENGLLVGRLDVGLQKDNDGGLVADWARETVGDGDTEENDGDVEEEQDTDEEVQSGEESDTEQRDIDNLIDR